MPVQYRIADTIVDFSRKVLGRHHVALRSTLARSARWIRCPKSPCGYYGTLRMVIKPLPFVGPASAGGVRLLKGLARGFTFGRAVASSLWRRPSQARRLVGALAR